MYRRILVPLDKSQVAEAVLPRVRAIVTPTETELMLLHVVRPVSGSLSIGDRIISSLELEEAECGKAQGYLKPVADRLKGDGFQVRTAVKVEKDVAQAIVECAKEEEVDLIAMYTHDRSGLGRFLARSIAEKVRRIAHTEVRVFTAKELATV